MLCNVSLASQWWGSASNLPDRTRSTSALNPSLGNTSPYLQLFGINIIVIQVVRKCDLEFTVRPIPTHIDKICIVETPIESVMLVHWYM